MSKAPKPWQPVKYSKADVTAVQSLLRDDADAGMRKRGMDFIIENICGTYDMSFRPGPDGTRETDIAEGKRHVGNQIVKFLKLNVSQLKED